MEAGGLARTWSQTSFTRANSGTSEGSRLSRGSNIFSEDAGNVYRYGTFADPGPASESTGTKVGRALSHPVAIVLYAIALNMLFQELAGSVGSFGGSTTNESPPQPEQGDYFTTGSQKFDDVHASLQTASAKGWRGAAADDHAAARNTLVAQAERMGYLDDQMAQGVKGHSDSVAETQSHLWYELAGLVVVLGVATGLV